MDLILNRRIRKRTLILPIRQEAIRSARHPKTGRVLARVGESVGTVTKQCPVAEGGSYDLQARPPHERYDRWLQEAEGKPTRARAVLWLIERCEQPRKTIRITVRKVERRGENWIVTFSPDAKEEMRDLLAAGQPVFLARASGYTTSHDEIGAGEVMARFPEDLARARKEAREGRGLHGREAAAKLQKEAETCRDIMATIKQQTRIKRAIKEIQLAEEEAAAEARDMLRASERAASGTSHSDDAPFSGTTPEASLESAA
jgi:hypothetical protein